MRIVVDSNVYVSLAVYARGKPRRLWNLIRRRKYKAKVIVSSVILGEVRAALAEDFGWEGDRIERWLRRIRKHTRLVKPTQKVEVVERDPDDNRVIECALKGKADFIITGDRDLLELREYKTIRIVTVAGFLSTLV